MGTYLNPGNESHKMNLSSDIYIDKTPMIQYLNTVINTSQRYVSVSRPRRFGKTMAADMLAAYYDCEADSRSIFEVSKLSACDPVSPGSRTINWDTYLSKFNVIRLVMTDFLKRNRSIAKSLEVLQNRILDELNETYPDVKYDPDDLFYSMDRFYRHSGTQFVVIIDEWDAVFRIEKNNKDGQTQYLDFLRDWFKDKSYIALVYMTGILPIKKYGQHSALNMFDDYSVIQPMRLAEYTGFTEQEVRELCDEYEMDFSLVSNWYDGYKISNSIPVDKRKLFQQGDYKDQMISIYSPLSVVKAMRSGMIDNYWNKTETYEALAEYIRRDYDGLKEAVALLMDGGRVSVDLTTYQNDMTTFHGRDDILALLIHLGYLGYEGNQTETGIDFNHGQVYIPNKEILEEFKTSTKSSEWTETFVQFKHSQELLKATSNMIKQKKPR